MSLVCTRVLHFISCFFKFLKKNNKQTKQSKKKKKKRKDTKKSISVHSRAIIEYTKYGALGILTVHTFFDLNINTKEKKLTTHNYDVSHVQSFLELDYCWLIPNLQGSHPSLSHISITTNRTSLVEKNNNNKNNCVNYFQGFCFIFLSTISILIII